MKAHIEELIRLGLSLEQATNIVRKIAEESFSAGEGNVSYDDEFGFDTWETFDFWFEKELK